MILKTRNKLLCFIAANKFYLSKKTTYIFRNNFVSLSVKIKIFLYMENSGMKLQFW